MFRSIWTLNISVGDRGSQVLDGNIVGTVLALLEVFRRFIWNFFRLENEHLNNAGDFRVVRDISVHPVDLSQLPAGDEEEANSASVGQGVGRKMSTVLSDVSTFKLLDVVNDKRSHTSSTQPYF